MSKFVFILAMGLCVYGCYHKSHQVKAQSMHGSAYSDAVKCALMVKGEAYKEGSDTGKDADLYLPPGEHPLDDERIDDWDGKLACRWPDEYPDSHDDGAAYKESQVAPECFDCD